MARFAEAEARKFKNVFVCRKCKSKIRAQPIKVKLGKVKCRKCGSKALRPVRKK
ncbi:50S ribosomal protein L40e [Candidatus Woesearchaeota archaeon]|nr:50S ribosomal protein L40e [Candidatus Woesearchaeota archaeon]RLE40482.1 MAG: 50S ribosomal protein L40e [Candidatus Woesearchaeota archaeon]